MKIQQVYDTHEFQYKWQDLRLKFPDKCRTKIEDHLIKKDFLELINDPLQRHKFWESHSDKEEFIEYPKFTLNEDGIVKVNFTVSQYLKPDNYDLTWFPFDVQKIQSTLPSSKLKTF